MAPEFTSACSSACSFCRGDWYVLLEVAEIEVMMAPKVLERHLDGKIRDLGLFHAPPACCPVLQRQGQKHYETKIPRRFSELVAKDPHGHGIAEHSCR